MDSKYYKITYNRILGDLNNLMQECNDAEKSMSKDLSNLDLAITDIQHCIEFEKLDAVKSVKLMKILKSTLQERRLVKDNLREIQQVKCKMVDDKISVKSKFANDDTRVYMYRTNTLSSIGFSAGSTHVEMSFKE